MTSRSFAISVNSNFINVLLETVFLYIVLFGLNVKYNTSEIRSKIMNFCIEMFLGLL
jgi:hypothetical protein